MIEELLELLFHKVDTDLLESVELEYFKSGDVQHTDKVYLLHGWIQQSCIAHVNKISKETTKNILDYRTSTNSYSYNILSFVDPFSPNL